MHRLLSLFMILSLVCCKPNVSQSPEENKETTPEVSETTTFFFVRHAEKEKDQKDPSLTKEGQDRAKNLATMLQDIPLDAIFSSDYKRTRETAEPIATQKSLKVQLYDPSDLEASSKDILAKHTGGKILVVGHSNTTPNFVNLLAGSQQALPIDESEYNNLYIVNFNTKGSTDVLRLRF